MGLVNLFSSGLSRIGFTDKYGYLINEGDCVLYQSFGTWKTGRFAMLIGQDEKRALIVISDNEGTYQRQENVFLEAPYKKMFPEQFI